MTQETSGYTSNNPSISRDVLIAAQQLGHAHNMSALARALGKGATVMANKLNPDCDHHHLTLGEAVAITDLTDDDRILQAWALSRGQMLVSVPTGAVCDEDLMELVLLAQCVFGRLMGAIHEARSDGVIDALEHGQIERVGIETAEHVMNLIRSTGANVRPLPAQSGRK